MNDYYCRPLIGGGSPKLAFSKWTKLYLSKKKNDQDGLMNNTREIP